jgi:glycine cleavage system H protein
MRAEERTFMPEYLETTADKFTFRVATDRLYTREGVWALFDGTSKHVQVGLADYPQQHSGDVAFANVESRGTTLAAGAPFAEIETIKAMVEVHSPVAGTIMEVNAALETGPEVINQSPYEAGWLARIEPINWEADRTALLDAAAYFAVMQAQLQEELKNL